MATRPNKTVPDHWDDLNAWKQVRDAIETHWPEIGHNDLNSCSDDIDAMVEFVARRVQTPRDEIEAVIRQHLILEHPSLAARFGALGQQWANRPQQAWAQIGQACDKRPATMLAAVFVTGLLTGMIATAMCCSSDATTGREGRDRGDW